MINQKVDDNAENIINMIIVDSLRDPLLVLDDYLKIMWANRSFYEFFQEKPEEIIGKKIFAIGNRQWDIPKLRKFLDEVLQKETVINDFEVEHDFPIIGHKVMKLNARMTNMIKGSSKEILLAMEDITEHKQMDNEEKEYEARFRRLFETAHDGLLLLDHKTGLIVNVNQSIVELLGFSSEELLGKSLQDVGLLKEEKFQSILRHLNDSGFIRYYPVRVKTKAGKNIETEINVMDRTKLIQCNVRPIRNTRRDRNFRNSRY